MIFFDKDEPAHSTPSRMEIPAADTWDLTLLYPTDAAWDAAFEKLRAEFQSILAFRGRVGESAETLLAVLETEKTLDLQLERLGHYSMLRASEDSSDNVNLSRRARLQNLWTEISESSAFLVPEIVAISDETWSGFVKNKGLAPWLTRLERVRRMKPHTLSASEERLLALAGNALHGHSETFSQLTNVDMKFGTLRDAKGEERQLTQSSFSSFLISPDADVRKAAFHQFYGEFVDHQFTVASTLASSVRADVFEARARNYPSALEASLFHDAIPVSVYDNLISTVREYLAPLHDYYELRRTVLNRAELHAYDTYVPLISEMETNVSFDEAIDQVQQDGIMPGSTVVVGTGVIPAVTAVHIAGRVRREYDRAVLVAHGLPVEPFVGAGVNDIAGCSLRAAMQHQYQRPLAAQHGLGRRPVEIAGQAAAVDAVGSPGLIDAPRARSRRCLRLGAEGKQEQQ